MSDARLASPAAERNAAPIAQVLAGVLPAGTSSPGLVLEVASGSGQHVAHFARAFPALTWQPTDREPRHRASIAAWREEAALPNLLAPLELDVMHPWPVARADAMLCINMVHISPWEASLALFAGAGRILGAGALLYLYGPFRFDGVTAPSNLTFEDWLHTRDPRFGVRDVRDLSVAASAHTAVMPPAQTISGRSAPRLSLASNTNQPAL